MHVFALGFIPLLLIVSYITLYHLLTPLPPLDLLLPYTIVVAPPFSILKPPQSVFPGMRIPILRFFVSIVYKHSLF